MEADFTRYYQTDLRAATRGGQAWGVRRLLNHIEWLPPDSALQRSRMKAPMGWDNAIEMAASQVDLLQVIARILYNSNAKDPETSPLIQVQRPWAEPVKPTTLSIAQFNSLLEPPQ